ncbi:MAG: bifunctional oligoribonuclease/PAP phosphatase NrnA [Proteobacteria bacterium]|nr:bifunctional oligoribonuclease/PAP phosphatase NrnA [Pseudomonadota bacterium]
MELETAKILEATNGNGSSTSSNNPVVRNGSDANSSYKKISSLLENYRGQSHLIILQGTPDPDAISSGLALEFLGSQFDIDTTILCFHNVSHHENRALVKRLGIQLTRYSPEVDLSPYSIYSIVDSQRSQTPIDIRLNEHGIKLFAFIDHHREDIIPPQAMFVDIRPLAASTAAICTEYLKGAYPMGLTPGDPAQVRLATALMHGIRSDTSKFVTASRFDYEMSAYLAPCVDPQVIELIERKVLTSSMLDMFENALVNRRIHDNFIFSDVGFVRSVDRDGIPQVAELLLAREGTDTVLVFGIVDEKMIDGSLRTRSETINPDEFLKGFLGISPESGRYYGGGNIRDRGGFQIPLGFFSLHEDKNLVYTMARQVIENSFLDYIGKTEGKGTSS